jgi:hypothetical protein
MDGLGRFFIEDLDLVQISFLHLFNPATTENHQNYDSNNYSYNDPYIRRESARGLDGRNEPASES